MTIHPWIHNEGLDMLTKRQRHEAMVDPSEILPGCAEESLAALIGTITQRFELKRKDALLGLVRSTGVVLYRLGVTASQERPSPDRA